MSVDDEQRTRDHLRITREHDVPAQERLDLIDRRPNSTRLGIHPGWHGLNHGKSSY
jgi:hypothetical protein